jgi:integrase
MLLGECIRARAASDGGHWSKDWANSVQRCARAVDEQLEVPIHALTIADVERYFQSFGDRHYEANRQLSVLRATWAWAQKRDLVDEWKRNPASAITPHPEPAPIWVAEAGALGELLESIEIAGEREVITARDCQAMSLLGLMSRRSKDILRRRAEDVDRRSRTLHLGVTKNGKIQQVPLEGRALDWALAAVERVGGRGPLFTTSSGRTLPPAGLNDTWSRVLKVAGELGLTTVRSDGHKWLMRDMRALGVTSMLRAGVPVPVICKVTGHSAAMVSRYERLNVEDAREAVRAMHKEEERQNTTTKISSGARFQQRRLELGLKPTPAAKLLGFASRQSIHDIEAKGLDTLPICRVQEIAELLGTDLAGLGFR